jgi:hypothetical protein
MKAHYHVVINLAGYMPDSEPNYCTTLTDARNVAQSHADDFRNFIADGEGDTHTVLGNKREGYVIDDPANPYHLPTYISINECYESDCADVES